MPTPPDAPASSGLGERLQSVRQRLFMQHVLRASAVGLAVLALVIALATMAGLGQAVATTTGVVLAMVVGVATAVAMGAHRTTAAAARALERADPSLRNLVVTAEELMASPDRGAPYMRARVLTAAAHAAGRIDSRRAASLSRDAGLTVVAALVLVSVVALRGAVAPRAGAGPSSGNGSPAAAPGDGGFTIDLTPPAYTGRPATRLINPTRIEALTGSRAVIRAGGARLVARLNDRILPRHEDGSADAVLETGGYVAIETDARRQLLPLTVTSDRVPEVRITAPGRDLRVASAKTRIPIVVSAIDDLGLQSLAVRYTVVSGVGEELSFKEGSLPVAVAKESSLAWRGEGSLSLAALGLEPGDALVYRGVAADGRPGEGGAGTSESYFVEVAGPGDVALPGVEMPPDKERYALSQAMIVLKLERLLARARSMPRSDLEEESSSIGAEQRAVRANFIFLLGGEIEDEVVEAETSHEIQEGRLANQARTEIVGATVLMGRVEQALAGVSPAAALPPARDAVKALQRAFGHSRYLLRALPSRARLDPARRLSGDLSSASDWNRALAPPAPDTPTGAARDALLELLDIARDPGRPEMQDRLGRLAERVLTIDAGAGDLQASAQALVTAREALASGELDKARARLQAAAAPIVARAQRGRIVGGTEPREPARLAGAAALAGGGAR